MRAKVVEVRSGSEYVDGVSRVVLAFESADLFAKRLCVPNSTKSFAKPLALDDNLEVTITRVKE
jgi:hypothetical protein